MAIALEGMTSSGQGSEYFGRGASIMIEIPNKAAPHSPRAAGAAFAMDKKLSGPIKTWHLIVVGGAIPILGLGNKLTENVGVLALALIIGLAAGLAKGSTFHGPRGS